MMRRGRIGPGRERNGRRIETDGDVVLLGLQGVGEVVVGAGDGGASVTGVEVVVEQRGVEVEQREGRDQPQEGRVA